MREIESQKQEKIKGPVKEGESHILSQFAYSFFPGIPILGAWNMLNTVPNSWRVGGVQMKLEKSGRVFCLSSNIYRSCTSAGEGAGVKVCRHTQTHNAY